VLLFLESLFGGGLREVSVSWLLTRLKVSCGMELPNIHQSFLAWDG
jgi:hypothetical protein